MSEKKKKGKAIDRTLGQIKDIGRWLAAGNAQTFSLFSFSPLICLFLWPFCEILKIPLLVVARKILMQEGDNAMNLHMVHRVHR